PERVVEVVNGVGLKAAQLHGREPPGEVAWVRQRVRRVIQGFTAGDPALTMASDGPADVVLVEAPKPEAGRVFDWGQIGGALDDGRLTLAGGLSPPNAAQAGRRVRPPGRRRPPRRRDAPRPAR